MKRFYLVLLLAAVGMMFACQSEKYKVTTHTDSNDYTYTTVADDPLQTRVYVLDNGLTVYLSANPDEPRITTLIGVRAGSTSDPIETTGLAHYFEHMMFKGTDQIGTVNWAEEEPLLKEIENLFEEHKNTSDPEAKKRIYKSIDSLSAIAATYVATNEYDKMVSSIGAKSTNAGTSYDYTVYINDIPANELQKWLSLESERFSDIVLRLFHTELETVYEEFNMYQDRDRSRAMAVMMEALFPNHPYGRDVIGLPEHLKNPSMKNIYEFAHTWYVPNNMAVALAGDLDFDATIRMIDETFGKISSKELPEIVQPVEVPLEGPVVKEVSGPDAESLMLAFRFDGDYSYDNKIVTMISQLLSNGQAGLIDLNLVQQQKVLNAYSFAQFLKDYGMHVFAASPRQDQSLEEVKDLMLEQLDKIKNGEFDDWMLEALVNDMRLSEIRSNESNFSRVYNYVDSYVKGVSIDERLRFLDSMEEITKEEIVNFANANYNDNYVVVYKRHGVSDNITRVEKPALTPIPINKEYQSEFYKEFASQQSEDVEPVFVNFEEQIEKSELMPGVDMFYIKNKNNEIFTLNYIIDMGKNHNRLFPLAVNYLPYLGTDKYTAAELQRELFRLGLSFGVSTGDDRSYVYITGLSKSYVEAIGLLENVLKHAQPDQQAYSDYVDGLLKKQSNSKKNQNAILWGGLLNYGIYGRNSSFRNVIPDEELKAIDPATLTDMIAAMTNFEHKIFYYGPASFEQARKEIESLHTLPDMVTPLPEETNYVQLDNTENKVYLVDYDMVQANVILVSKSSPFDKNLIAPSQLFGEYFGGGLSSIVFQEIRESRALAYSAFSTFSIPRDPRRNNVVYGYVGTQADKLEMATTAMLDLMNQMPVAEKQFELAKESIIKKINTERIIKDGVFWTYLNNMDKGIDYDIRRDVYEYANNVTIDSFRHDFFDKFISGRHYNFMILGNKNSLDMAALSRIAKPEVLTLEEVFNY
ncbi:MAG: insulinase family protein [Bacteroidales bacterium]|nr:insulinase family protein [Bacteroidales bacterium]MDD4177365.1 insulinase family protein [Bacteroidales bacterium]